MRSIVSVLAGLGFAVTCVHAQNSADAQTLRLVRFPKSAYQLVASQMVEDIYKRSGLKVTIDTMPPQRATIEARAGRIQGEVSRVENYFLENPDLIRVTPSYTNFTMAAFARKPMAIQSKEDLARYKVGIVRGLQASINLTEGLSNVEQAINSESLFAMLGAGRIDVAIDVDVNGQFAIHKLGVADAKNVGTLLKAEGYTGLSPASAHLAGRLSKTIVQMKKSGELERLKHRLEEAFIKSGIEPD